MTDLINPMLEDDDDYTVEPLPPVPTFRPIIRKPTVEVAQPHPVETTEANEATATVASPKFGEKGFGKGVRKSNAGKPRLRTNYDDALVCAFGAKFAVFELETASMLREAKRTNVSRGGGLLSLRGTALQLDKLKNEGLLESEVLESGREVWGTTPRGVSFARRHGFLSDENEVTEGMAGIQHLWLDHYLYTAHVAAQLISPAGYFRDSLGLEPASINDLQAESQVRRVHDPIKRQLEEAAKDGGNGDYGKWRKELIQQIIELGKAGKLKPTEILESYPELLTVGEPRRHPKVEAQVISTHHPDLVLVRPNERNGRGTSIGFEIELTAKTTRRYRSYLRTYKGDFTNGSFAYDRWVYISQLPAVGRRLRAADSQAGTDLFDGRRLYSLPLLNRDGAPIEVAKPELRGGATND